MAIDSSILLLTLATAVERIVALGATAQRMIRVLFHRANPTNRVLGLELNRATWVINTRHDRGRPDSAILAPGLGSDVPRGVRWLEKAAELKSPSKWTAYALSLLGTLYKDSVAVVKNESRARKYWQRGAKLEILRAAITWP